MSSTNHVSLGTSSGTRIARKLVHGCYFPYWSSSCSPPSTMNLSIITHVFYAFAKVTEDGTIGHIDEEADLKTMTNGLSGRIPACIALKDRHPVKVLISIGGGMHSGSFAKMASTDFGRKNFACSVRVFVDKYKFDSVDLDWEQIENTEDGQNYVLLLQVLREYLTDCYLLTSALTAGEWSLRNIDIFQASLFLDFINLMCYDFAGPWSETSGHQAQLYAPISSNAVSVEQSCDSAVRYLISKHVLPSKIVMGIPVYGRSFTGAKESGQKASGHDEQIYRGLPCHDDAKEFIDQELGAAGCICKHHGFFTYDTPESVTMKAKYARTSKLRGLFYWTGIYDAPPGPRSLMTAGYNAMVASSGKGSNLELVTAAESSTPLIRATGGVWYQ